MANAKFFYFNYIVQDETELSVSSGGENPFYPLTNLKHRHALKTFRSSSSVTSVIVMDCQAAVTVNSFLAVASSIGTLDLTAVTIEGNATDSWVSPAFSTTVSDFDYVEGKASKFFTAETYRYWRLTLTGTAAFVEVGKLFLGSSVSLDTNNISIGFDFGKDDLSEVSRGRYGQVFIDEITDLETLNGQFQLLNTTEQATIQAMYDYCGKRNPVWLMVDPDEGIIANKDVLFGYYYFMDRPKFKNDFYGLYSSNFSLYQAK